MIIDKQKSYGERYLNLKVKAKISKKKLLLVVIIFLFCCEIVLGTLWALGY